MSGWGGAEEKIGDEVKNWEIEVGNELINSEVAKNDRKNDGRHTGAEEDSQQGAEVFSDWRVETRTLGDDFRRRDRWYSLMPCPSEESGIWSRK